MRPDVEAMAKDLRRLVDDCIRNEHLRTLCHHVINNPSFQIKPGSKSHHHNYPTGLLEHTLDVTRRCWYMAGDTIDFDVLITSAVWHDFHKIYEYEWNEKDKCVIGLSYRYYIGHVVGSTIEFLRESYLLSVPEDIVRPITHCMLAHHGRTEWRSPVEPQTPEAWILHSADMLSCQGNH